MKCLVVFVVLCVADTFSVPLTDGRPIVVEARAISQELEPPALPRANQHHHHHTHNQPQTRQPTRAPNTRPQPTRAQTTKPQPTRAPTTRYTQTRAPVTTRPPVTNKAPVHTTKVPNATSKPAMSSSDIVKYEYNTSPDGGYSFLYETSDGQKRNEVGYFRDDPTLGRILNVRGSYEYLDSLGHLVAVHYVADENGYRQQEGSPPPEPQLSPVPPASISQTVIATLTG